MLLLPHELGAFLAGIFAPLAFVWLALFFFVCGHEMRDTAAVLREELRRLTCPAEDAEERVQGIEHLFRQQAQELTMASQQAVRQVANIGNSLRKHATEMTVTQDRASEQAAEIGTIIVDQAQALSDSANKAEAQAKVIRQNAFESRRDTLPARLAFRDRGSELHRH